MSEEFDEKAPDTVRIAPGALPPALPTKEGTLPTLQPLDAEPVYPEAPKKPGFSFGIAVAWCLLYLVIAQILPGVGIVSVAVWAILQEQKQAPPADNNTKEDLLENPILKKASMISIGVSHFFGIAFSVFMLWKWIGPSWKRIIAFSQKPTFLHTLLVLIAMPPLLACSIYLESVLVKIPSMKDLVGIPGLEDMMKEMQAWKLWWAILFVAVLPAIGEELWCRGFLGQGLSARYGLVWGIIGTSFLFGALHLEPPQAVFAMIFGVVLHCCYLATRSILVPMGMHFINNSAAMIHVNDHGFPILNSLEDAKIGSSWGFGITSVALVASIGYALYQTRVKNVPNHPVGDTTLAKLSGVEIPPSDRDISLVSEPISVLSVSLITASAIGFSLFWMFG